MWNVVAASVTGKLHLDSGTRCEDAHAWACEGPWLVAAVADGAGSVAHAREGAELCVAHVVASLTANLREAGAHTVGLLDLRGQVADAIREVRAALADRTPSDPDGILEYAATVIGAVMGPTGGLLFHIGDGMGVAFGSEEGSTQYASQPENGAHSWLTFFYTDPDWEEHLRFTETGPEVEQVLLLTDGAVELAVRPPEYELGAPFPVRLAREVGHLPPRAASATLAAILADPGTWAVTNDDKSVLWVRRSTCC